MVLSSALHLFELVVGDSEVIAGPEAIAVPVVVFLSSWIRIPAKSTGHIHVLADDTAHMHAVE